MVVFKLIGWSLQEDDNGDEVRSAKILIIWPDGREKEIEMVIDDEYHLHP